MKTIYKILLLTIILQTSAFSQFEVLSIIKPTTSEEPCDGKINLKFVESELPYDLDYSSSTGQQGSYQVTTTVFSITGLCAGNISISATDNHGCDTELDPIELEECGDLDVSFRPLWSCNSSSLDIGIHLYRTNEESIEDFDFTWNDGSITSDLIDINPGIYSVTFVDDNGCKGVFENIDVFYPYIESYSYPTNTSSCDGSITIKAPNWHDINGKTWYKIELYNKYDNLVYSDDGWEGGSKTLDGLCDFGQYRIVVTDLYYWCDYELFHIFNDSDCNLEVNVVDIQGTADCAKFCWGSGLCNSGFIELDVTGDVSDVNRYEFFINEKDMHGNYIGGIGHTKFDNLEAHIYEVTVRDKDNHLCRVSLPVEVPKCGSVYGDNCEKYNISEENDFEISKENIYYSNNYTGNVVVKFKHPSEDKSFVVKLKNKDGVEMHGEIVRTNNLNSVTFYISTRGEYDLSVNNGCGLDERKISINYISCKINNTKDNGEEGVDCGGPYCAPCKDDPSESIDCSPKCKDPEQCKKYNGTNICMSPLCGFFIEISDSPTEINYKKHLFHDLYGGSTIKIKDYFKDDDLNITIKQNDYTLWESRCDNPAIEMHFKLINDAPITLYVNGKYCIGDSKNNFKIGFECPCDCFGDEICINGKCYTPCYDGECPEGYTCKNIEGEDVCVPDASDGCGEDCTNNGGQCIDDKCMYSICDYEFHYNEPNGEPLFLSQYLFADGLLEGQRIHLVEYNRGIGLSVRFRQNDKTLWEVSCTEEPCGYYPYPDCNHNDERYFRLLYSNIPVLLEVKPNEIESDNECFGLKTLFDVKLECVTGQRQDIASSNDFESKNRLFLYPNPFTSTFSIFSQKEKIKEIQVFNTIGQLVNNLKLDNPNLKTNIDLKNEPAGIFYVKILLKNNEIVTKKIVKSY